MTLLEMLHDCIVELITGDTDGFFLHNAGECNDSDLGPASTDINDHVSHRSID